MKPYFLFFSPLLFAGILFALRPQYSKAYSGALQQNGIATAASGQAEHPAGRRQRHPLRLRQRSAEKVLPQYTPVNMGVYPYTNMLLQYPIITPAVLYCQ